MSKCPHRTFHHECRLQIRSAQPGRPGCGLFVVYCPDDRDRQFVRCGVYCITAQRDRLRAALVKIANITAIRTDPGECFRIAEAALAEVPDGD